MRNYVDVFINISFFSNSLIRLFLSSSGVTRLIIKMCACSFQKEPRNTFLLWGVLWPVMGWNSFWSKVSAIWYASHEIGSIWINWFINGEREKYPAIYRVTKGRHGVSSQPERVLEFLKEDQGGAKEREQGPWFAFANIFLSYLYSLSISLESPGWQEMDIFSEQIIFA